MKVKFTAKFVETDSYIEDIFDLEDDLGIYFYERLSKDELNQVIGEEFMSWFNRKIDDKWIFIDE